MRVYLAVLLPTAFVLHLVWEYLQCQPFFSHGTVPATTTAMLVATLGDVALTAIGYVGVAAAAREWDWPVHPWPGCVWVAMLTLAVLLSVAIERYGIATGRWGYTALAPRMPFANVSLVPVLQLTILFPVSFAMARLATRRIQTRG